MKFNSPPPDKAWEGDAVWKLLDKSPSRTASARFADDTLRAARLVSATVPWWIRLFSPAPLAGLAATAAVILAFVSALQPEPESGGPAAITETPQAIAIEDIAETETLIAAADQLDDFSDHELVSLIGF